MDGKTEADRLAVAYAQRVEADARAAEKDLVWLAERRTFELDPTNRIEVAIPPARWHRALARQREALHAEANLMAAKAAERDKRNGKPARMDVNNLSFERSIEWFEREGSLLLRRHGRMAFRVTPRTLERALSVANAICFAANSRGMSANVDDGGERMLLSWKEASTGLRVTETLSDGVLTQFDERGKVHPVLGKVPTGRLSVVVGSSFSEARFTDAPAVPVEQVLNQVFIRIWTEIAKDKRHIRDRATSKLGWEAKEAKAAELSAEAARQEALRQQERERRAALLLAAQRWSDAALIRAYVSDQTARGADKAWSAWAGAVADELDPGPAGQVPPASSFSQ